MPGTRPRRRRRDRKPRPPFPTQHQRRPGLESRISPRPKYRAPRYRGSGKLQGKVALVTGGDSGIGRAVATLFAREGADVAIVYLPAEQPDADETLRSIEAEGQRGMLVPGDVSDPRFAPKCLAAIVREFGHLDVLVNNAAYQQHQERPEDVSDEQFERTLRTNILGYFYMVKAALEYLGRGSTIINTGSITGLEGSPQLLDYSASKGAIHAFTKSLAANLVDRGIRVNCVAPGPIWTPLNVADKPAKEAAEHGADVPMGRPGQPEEVAPIYVYFASAADSSYVTGEVFTLLGGEMRAA